VESLRWSLFGFATLPIWAALHMFAAKRTYLQDLVRAAEPAEPVASESPAAPVLQAPPAT
jgi:hypothetical protein